MNYHQMAATGFFLLTFICIIMVFLGLKKGVENLAAEEQKKTLRVYLMGISIWICVVSALSISGFLSDFSTFPPRMAIVLFTPMILLVLILRTPHIDNILQNIPPSWLLHIQFFRVIVEISIWLTFLAGEFPERMSFEGWNFDILAGITGPIFAYLCFANGKFNKKLAIIWNIAGLLLLFNIVSIALMTMPSPFQYFTNEDNTIVATFPFVWLPALLVPLAYYSHIFSLRQLLKKT